MNRVKKGVPRSVIAAVVAVAVLLGVWLVPIAPKVATVQANGDSRILNVANWSEEEYAGVSGRETVLKVDGTYHMWYSSSDEKTLYHTCSEEPTGFENGPECTFSLPGNESVTDSVYGPGEVGSITVWYENEVYYMIAYETEAIANSKYNQKFAIYTSADGKNWAYGHTVFDGEAAFGTSGVAIPEDFAKIDAPYLFNDTSNGNAWYRLYFQVKTSDGSYYIYTAESTAASLADIADEDSGADFILAENNPVLSPDLGKWDGKQVMHPWVVKDAGMYYMWYSGWATGMVQQLGFAYSYDGYEWTKSRGNPIMEPATGYAEPSVILEDGTWQMWCLARDEGSYKINYLTATGPFEFSAIQAAINAADEGDTINVAPGMYDEQVVIDKSLTLQGAGDTTIIKPSSADKLTQVFDGLFWYGVPDKKNVAGIIVANVADGRSVTIKDLKVDESFVTTKPTGADYLAGIFYRETGGTVDTVTVAGTGAWSSIDRAYGMYLSAGTNTVTVEVKNSTITNFDKNGIEAMGNKLTANIHHNTITGRGSISDEAQNGVNIGRNAIATVNYNAISNLAYEPKTSYATGILAWHYVSPTGVSFTANGNNITNCQVGVSFEGANGEAQGNTVAGGAVGLTGLVAQYREAGTWTATFIGNTVTAANDTSGYENAAIICQTFEEDVSITFVADNNTLTGNTGTTADGIYIANAKATITDNTVSGWQHGIFLDGSVGAGSTITGNTITNNALTDSGIHIDETVDATNVDVHLNNIVGNEGYGVYNGSTNTLDARYNWWGNESGPSGGASDPVTQTVAEGDGDTVSENVHFDPWLKSDIFPPKVVSTDPYDGATGVPPSRIVTVTFDEDVQKGSNFDDIVVETGNIRESIGCSISGRTLNIEPVGRWAYGTTYTVTIPEGAVADMGGGKEDSRVAPLPNDDHTFIFTTIARIPPAPIEPTPTPPGAIEPVTDSIVADAIREAEETGEVVIEVPKEEIALTVDQLRRIAGVGKPAVIRTDEVGFVLPPEIVSDLAETDAVQIEITAKKIAEDEAPTAPLGLKLAGEVFEIEIAAIDEEGNRHVISRFAKPLRVSFPVPSSARDTAASGKLDVYRYDEEAKIWKGMGGTYDAATNVIIFTTDRLSKYALMERTAPPIKTFTDIKGHWAQSDIEVMAGLGIVQGISEHIFAPEMPVNRAQFAAFLIRSLEIEEASPVTPHFKDLQPDAWYYGAVEGAYAAGLIKGYEDGTFRPEREISREESAALIARALKYAGQEVTVDDIDAVLGRFKDANEISSWAKEEAAQAVASGIIIGRDGLFAPKDNATRAEAVVMLKRMLVELGII